MQTRKRAVVFGASGQLGSQIARLWDDFECIAPPRSLADVENAAAVERVIAESRPDVVINCTAFNDVPRAENEPDAAFRLNAEAVDRLAGAAAQHQCIYVTVSTDYVFDGSLGRPYTEDDRPNPVNVYGASKLAGEGLVLARNGRAYVVRTCGLYGTGVSSSKGHTFIARILQKARDGEPLRVVDDQIISPTFAGHLALALRSVIERQAPFGLYHAVNEGAVSWYEFAAEALRQAGHKAAIEPISSAEFAAPVRRPKFSALENARLHALGLGLPPWQDGIAAYLAAVR
jgi:dTDP-4-dehydrorhamnose reductase